ncbi:MAG: EamA family transporter [Candidatus Portnoybacteria bacterium]|nr:EamA family transporter [Candidatus Portnoybacteria bacterium]
MIWILIAIAANFFYAIVFIIDKYIVSKPLPQPIVYSFYVGILSLSVWALAPFGLTMINASQMPLILIAGIAQVGGWMFMYKSLSMGEVSRIVPFIGGLIGVFTLILSMVFLQRIFDYKTLLAMLLLILGSLIMATPKKEKDLFKFKKTKEKRFKQAFLLALAASFLFACFWIATKYIFIQTSFISGIVWTRTGVAIISLLLLIPSKNRKLIFNKTKTVKTKTAGFVLASRLFSIIGALGIYFAVYIGNVAVVNSLQGTQYIFILILAFFLFKKLPKLKEQFNQEILIQKISAIILICIGLSLLIT